MNYLDINSNNVKNVTKINTNQTEVKEIKTSADKKHENKEKYIKYAMAGLAAAGIAAVCIHKYKKGQALKLSDINFDKGVASLKNGGEKYTGKIKDTLKNGDKIILEYENGIIKNSARKGSKTIQKFYSTENGDKIVKIIENGKERISNITKLSQQGREKAEKAAREALQKAIKEAEEKAAKEAAEKAVKEAEAKAKALKEAEEKAAKEAAEKAAKEAEEKAAKEAAKEAAAKNNVKEIQVVDLSQDIPEKGACPIYGYTFAGIDDISKIRDLDKKSVLEFLEKNKDLTPDDLAKVFGTFKDGKYDIPDKFLIAVNNQLTKTGSSLIVDEVPEMFKGMKPEEIQKAIEKLQLVHDPRKITQFTMGGKEFCLEKIGSGQIGYVYKLSDKANNSVALKFFKDNFLTGTQGAYAEIPIARQASLEKVSNVPKFFMSNPFGTMDNDGVVKGAWQMVEYITPDKKITGQGPKFFEWLKSKDLTFADFNAGSKVGNYIVDLGGVIKPAKEGQALKDVNLALSDETSSSMIRGILKNNETVAQWIEKLKKAL